MSNNQRSRNGLSDVLQGRRPRPPAGRSCLTLPSGGRVQRPAGETPRVHPAVGVIGAMRFPEAEQVGGEQEEDGSEKEALRHDALQMRREGDGGTEEKRRGAAAAAIGKACARREGDQHQGRCPCHPALAAEGSGARGGRAAPHSQAEAVGGRAVKGALRPCFRSPERWSCSDEPGARPLTGMFQGGRCGPVRCRSHAGRGAALP